MKRSFDFRDPSSVDHRNNMQCMDRTDICASEHSDAESDWNDGDDESWENNKDCTVRSSDFSLKEYKAASQKTQVPLKTEGGLEGGKTVENDGNNLQARETSANMGNASSASIRAARRVAYHLMKNCPNLEEIINSLPPPVDPSVPLRRPKTVPLCILYRSQSPPLPSPVPEERQHGAHRLPSSTPNISLSSISAPLPHASESKVISPSVPPPRYPVPYKPRPPPLPSDMLHPRLPWWHSIQAPVPLLGTFNESTSISPSPDSKTTLPLRSPSSVLSPNESCKKTNSLLPPLHPPRQLPVTSGVKRPLNLLYPIPF